MRAIMVMFDSLNRHFLPNYGCEWTHAPNFRRLAERTVTFDKAYGGSMPCMPARRELHTARYNFLHRSWGPLEPFDDSIPQMLSDDGVYTHLATDHQHYFEDGGATYHGRFNSFEFFRGQVGDRWKGNIGDPKIPETHRLNRHPAWRQDWVNRGYLADPADHPQTLVFNAGIEFLAANAEQDRWFLQLECSDPHEPFFSYDDHKKLYPDQYDGPQFDWPDYKKTDESPVMVEHVRKEYAALLSMCDDSLGRVMDFMDSHDMWQDTMLIVCTDHGLMLGEHNWWGKNVQPWYEENIHIPLFAWDPGIDVAGVRREALVQTIDLGPTLLRFFGLEPTERMQGKPLQAIMEDGGFVRDAGLFGKFGAHVTITDGRYVYMRACATEDNSPLFEYTLMPTHMDTRFSPEELAHAEWIPQLAFSQEVPVLRIPCTASENPYDFGTLLFDLHEDPAQQHPLQDPGLELHMAERLVRLMRVSDAPVSQFERLGLPIGGPVLPEHLLIERQWERTVAATEQLPRASEFESSDDGVNRLVAELLADDWARRMLLNVLGPSTLRQIEAWGGLTLLEAATVVPSLSAPQLRRLDSMLTGKIV